MKNTTTMKIAKKDLPKLESLNMVKFRKHKAYVLFCSEGFKFANNSRLIITSTQQGIREAIKKITSINHAEVVEIEKKRLPAELELERLSYVIPTIHYELRNLDKIDWTGKRKPAKFELYNQLIECEHKYNFLVKNCIINEPRLDIFDMQWLMKKIYSLSSRRIITGEYEYRVTLSSRAYHKRKEQNHFVVVGNYKLFELLTMDIECKEA